MKDCLMNFASCLASFRRCYWALAFASFIFVGRCDMPDIYIPLPPTNGETTVLEDLLSFRRNQGKKLRELLSVDEGSSTLAYSSWFFPTSIVVNAVSYMVSTNEYQGFCLKENNECAEPVLRGSFMIKQNERETREAAFAMAALNNLGLQWVADRSVVNYLAINFLSLESDDEKIFISRNLCFRMRSATNDTDVVMALINAGVPESERIVLSPQVP